ncbi:hypothetical protein RJ640_011053 [Escallonia rubra]|uniref:Peptidase S54 rhomboid domain-containing protein n=1 Tax=Escallonia rubra TaxID=112253 RepID=A0AA88RK03_9ASTE|nr:hypothetical protein RJ640_011053 [Escallonia rubra]
MEATYIIKYRLRIQLWANEDKGKKDMAVNPIGCKLRYKGQALSIPKERTQNEGCFVSSTVSPDVSGSFSSISKDTSRRSHVLHTTSDSLVKVNIERKIEVSRGFIRSRGSMSFHILGEASFLSGIYKPMSHVKSSSNNSSEREKVCTVWNALESSSGQKQLRSLDSYFQKLQNTTNRATKPSNDSVLLLDISCQSNAKNGLASLEEYLGKVNEDAKSMDYVPSASDDVITKAARYPVMKGSQSEVKKRKNFSVRNSKSYKKHRLGTLLTSITVWSEDQSHDLVRRMVEATNTNVSGTRLMTGLNCYHGQHSGIFHVALGCWGLLTFGPQVCRAYGSLTFFLIYILGGLSGNMTSFLHTPEPTVGGTLGLSIIPKTEMQAERKLLKACLKRQFFLLLSAAL